MRWLRRRHRVADPPPLSPPPAPPPPAGSGLAARRAIVESRRALARDRARVDEWTGEIRELLGGS